MRLRHSSRPIQATISRSALAHNLSVLRVRAPDIKLFAVVKADAYGHGIHHVFEGLRAVNGFACLEIEEAEQLRQLGWRGPILLLEGAFEARDLEGCSRLQLWHVVHNTQQIDWLAAHKTHEPQQVFLKLNSGMNRLGFSPKAYRAAYARLDALPQVQEITHMTHFSDADTARSIEDQWGVFHQTTHDLPGERCLPNSAAVLRHMKALQQKTDWARVGIALYGASPDYPQHMASAPPATSSGPAAHWENWGLRPVMSLHSQIIAIQALQRGDSVGYGSGFVAKQPMRIGIVACGYADGYPRHAGNAPLGKGEPDARGALGAPVLVDGVRTRTLGRISMDVLCVDLTPVPQATLGTAVTLWGSDIASGETLPVDEVAAASLTIAYELLCAVAPRVPRLILE